MTTRDPKALLDALDPDQRRVAEQVSGPLCVLAGAGTGKTRAITYRIAYGAACGAVDPANVLAVTFTARAAAEMRQRLRALGVPHAQARTFHAAALRQLAYFWGRAVGGAMPAIVEHKASLVAAAAARCHVRVDRTSVRDLAAEIEWAKVSMLDAARYAPRAAEEGRTPPAGLSAESFARVLDAYEDAKQERGVIDFEDVLLLMCGVLEQRPDVARAVRAQYRSFVVDEYQDVSALQEHLLGLWLGGRSDICVVGDVAQTIYSFAGASPRFLTDFAARHPGARTVRLNRDYRSTPQIVAIANQVLARAADPRAPGRRGLAGAVHLVSQRPMGEGVSFHTYADDQAEAQGVAERIGRRLREGVPLRSVAILYRTNSQSESLEQALAQAGLSVLVRGGQRFFERDEVRRAVVLLRREAGPAGERSGAGGALAERVGSVLEQVGWSSAPPTAQGAVRERWDNLDALVNLAREREGRSLAEFVAELRERAAAQAAPAVEGVTLSTLHAAKGLEWDDVYLIGLSEGLMPISLADTPARKEEERRLLYVGVTRARNHLELSWARARSADRRASRRRSPFLAGIWPEEAAVGRVRAAQSPRHRAAARAEEFERNNSPETLALYQRLREWRSGVAHAAGKPAFTVLPDQTLRDVAIARPKTLRQLGVIRGIGEVKLDRFGASVLQVLRAYQDSPR